MSGGKKDEPELFDWLYHLSWVDFINVVGDIYEWTDTMRQLTEVDEKSDLQEL